MGEHTDVSCSNCGISVTWEPVWVKHQPYCCVGCALGGPCVCTYDGIPLGVHKDMKMICAILQDDDTRGLLDKLAERGLRATKVSSTGGFLRNGNSTILIGVEDGQVSGVLDILRATCRTRRQVIDVPEDSLPESIRVILPLPTEVEVGGANVFVWDIEDYIKV